MQQSMLQVHVCKQMNFNFRKKTCVKNILRINIKHLKQTIQIKTICFFSVDGETELTQLPTFVSFNKQVHSDFRNHLKTKIPVSGYSI